MTNSPTSPHAPPAVPRRAATVILVRDGAQGMEVLLLRRIERANDRSSGSFVFPGGTLDPADAQVRAACAGIDDAWASARLGLEDHGLDYYVAAIRECFEEAGVLLAIDAAGQPIALDACGADLGDLRSRLRRGEVGMDALCRTLGVRLAVDRLAYHSHWLTPVGLPKRFDTRFFIAEMPPGQAATPCSDETLEHRWLRPADALADAVGLRLPTPTRRTLQSLAGFEIAAACIAHAHALRDIRRILPAIADGPKGLQPVPPGDPAYAEVLRIDPHGTGAARYAIEPGRAVELSPRVRRVTASNAGLMTGPGTNTYLVGDSEGGDGWAVIDPGPPDAAHVDAILAAAPGPIRWILVTHTHRDHSPAAAMLKARTGAESLGMAALHEDNQDMAFQPERTLRHGERLQLGPRASLRVVHTPGHAANHLCYLLEEEKTLFTGDHVMQGSTVVINPPDGDMAAYIASLQALQGEDLQWLAPGHGFLIGEPHAAIERLLAHRRAREAKVARAMAELGDDLDALLPRVYDDVHPALHAAARRSLLAHVLKLKREAR